PSSRKAAASSLKCSPDFRSAVPSHRRATSPVEIAPRIDDTAGMVAVRAKLLLRIGRTRMMRSMRIGWWYLRRALLLAVGVLGMSVNLEPLEGQTRRTPGAGYDRPAANPHQSRSVVVAEHGIVATSQPLAAQAGLDILKAGGNAIDAAIAANAMIGLVEPMSCGIGGDLFVIYWDAKTKKLYGLNACGRSPYALNREVFAAKGMTQIPTNGPLSWSLPGCVDGWDELRRKFGTMTFAQTLKAAIDYAEKGFPVSEIIARGWD